MLWRPTLRAYSTAKKSYYEILEVPPSASIKEIKTKFRQLSKKFHPDLNHGLSEEEKEANKEKYLAMSDAYDTLKDVKKKKQYDANLRGSGPTVTATRAWQNEYYGEAKHYSRTHYSSSGYNTRRHRVRYNGHYHAEGSAFRGNRTDWANRYDVPHFDYDSHLKKNLQFEQHLLSKSLAPGDRDRIIQLLQKDGKPVDDEIITKHLQRQKLCQMPLHKRAHSHSHQHTAYMYQAPPSDSSLLPKLLLFGGATGGAYLLYQQMSK
ncbi:hypothetical protein DICA1_D20560 [Diutina catenulata]